MPSTTVRGCSGCILVEIVCWVGIVEAVGRCRSDSDRGGPGGHFPRPLGAQGDQKARSASYAGQDEIGRPGEGRPNFQDVLANYLWDVVDLVLVLESWYSTADSANLFVALLSACLTLVSISVLGVFLNLNGLVTNWSVLVAVNASIV